MQKKVLDNLFGGESISAYADGDHQGPAYYTIFSLQNPIKNNFYRRRTFHKEVL